MEKQLGFFEQLETMEIDLEIDFEWNFFGGKKKLKSNGFGFNEKDSNSTRNQDGFLFIDISGGQIPEDINFKCFKSVVLAMLNPKTAAFHSLGNHLWLNYKQKFVGIVIYSSVLWSSAAIVSWGARQLKSRNDNQFLAFRLAEIGSKVLLISPITMVLLVEPSLVIISEYMDHLAVCLEDTARKAVVDCLLNGPRSERFRCTKPDYRNLPGKSLFFFDPTLPSILKVNETTRYNIPAIEFPRVQEKLDIVNIVEQIKNIIIFDSET